jgi:hypothetical protein
MIAEIYDTAVGSNIDIDNGIVNFNTIMGLHEIYMGDS